MRAAWRRLTRGLMALLQPRRADADVDDEVAHWLAEAERAHRAAGLSADAARRRAWLEVGGAIQIRERVRASGWEGTVEAFAQDCRLAMRRLRSAPGFTVAAVVTLGVGIGAATAIYSVVRPVLLDALPYPDAERIRVIREVNRDGSFNAGTFGMYRAFAERSRAFESVAVLHAWQPTLAGQVPERVEGQRVSASYFTVLGTTPLMGRAFAAADDAPSADPVVILSHGLWQRRFGGRADIIASTIMLDDVAHAVVGVLDAGFENVLAPRAELWTTLRYDLAEDRAWGHHLQTIGRLRGGTAGNDAVRQLNAIGKSVIDVQKPITYAAGGVAWSAPSLRDDLTRLTRPALLAMLGAAALLLLMACVNVANLLLGRDLQRQPELALRLALGADRRRIARQFLAERLVLALPGGLLGVAVAVAGVRGLIALVPAGLPRVHTIGVDANALLFAAALTLAVGLLLGVAVLRGGGTIGHVSTTTRHTESRSRRRLRGALVVTQVALALVLLAGSGLLLRSLQRLFAVPHGFEASNAIALQIQTSSARYRDDALARRFFADVLDAAAAVPGVHAAALTNQLPLSGDAEEWGVHFDDDIDAGSSRSTFRYAVSADYFAALRIPLLDGRLLNDRDVAGAPLVAVISESLARRRFPDGSAIGRRLRIGPTDSEPFTVVGIAGDVTHQSLALGPSAVVYVSTAQWRFADGAMTLVVRARGDADDLVPALRAAIASVDPEQAVTRVVRLDDLLTATLREQRFAWLVFQAFALAALLLAATGLYGVIAGSVAARTREIGVRAALGARRGSVVRMVLGQGLRLTVAGSALGLIAALAASRAMQALLFGVAATDPATYAGVVVLLLAVTLIACGVPAWRAARIDPAITLRSD